MLPSHPSQCYGQRESVSLHLHGSSLHLPCSDAPAIATNPDAMAEAGATNPDAMAEAGATVTYRWMVEEDEPEGTHYFHSHGNTRQQTSHGLFGALIVEPKGSLDLDPLGGQLTSGWAAVIQYPTGADFREFAIYYHEIGNEAFTILNKSVSGNIGSRARAVPFVDEISGAYSRRLPVRGPPGAFPRSGNLGAVPLLLLGCGRTARAPAQGSNNRPPEVRPPMVPLAKGDRFPLHTKVGIKGRS